MKTTKTPEQLERERQALLGRLYTQDQAEADIAAHETAAVQAGNLAAIAKDDAAMVERDNLGLGQAEAFDADLRALVIAARAVTNGQHFGSPEAMKQAMGYLVAALDQFEPWLDADETPEQMGWVGKDGRP